MEGAYEIGHLKPTFNYENVPYALTISSCAFCIHGFRMILSVNSDYFLKQY
jgi:hypothetical protein